MKKIGQSIGLALWLWVHRPANCSHVANLSGYSTDQGICSDLGRINDQMGSCSIGSSPVRKECNQRLIDRFPDSHWLKNVILNETEESLPPIARAMKNILDHNMIIWDSQRQEEHPWPHFINPYRRSSHHRLERKLSDILPRPVFREEPPIFSPVKESPAIIAEPTRSSPRPSISSRLLLKPPRSKLKKKSSYATKIIPLDSLQCHLERSKSKTKKHSRSRSKKRSRSPSRKRSRSPSKKRRSSRKSKSKTRRRSRRKKNRRSGR